jgi:hypothetical protein
MTALTKTQRRLERWRAAHKKKARLPHDLKVEACGLLSQHSAREITKALGISTTLFAKWQRVADGHSPSPQSKRRRGGEHVLPAFIDVTPVTSSRSPVGGATLTVEVAGRGTIKLAGELSESAVRAAVAAAFAVAPAASAEVVL